MTPQELKMVCGELNEINGENMFCVGPLRKNCLLLIRTEKNVGVEKKSWTQPKP